jgi:hypothetical protein
MTKQLGFVITPAAFADRVNALDDAISTLTTLVDDNKETLGTAWVSQYDAFVRRWGVERSSYVDFTSRLFLSRAASRVDAFERSYRYWAQSFSERTKVRVPSATIRRPSDLTVIPSSVWIVGLFAIALFAFGGFRGRR